MIIWSFKSENYLPGTYLLLWSHFELYGNSSILQRILHQDDHQHPLLQYMVSSSRDWDLHADHPTEMQATPEEKRGNSYIRKKGIFKCFTIAKQKQNAGRYVQLCHMQGFVPVLRPMNVTRLGVQLRGVKVGVPRCWGWEGEGWGHRLHLY